MASAAHLQFHAANSRTSFSKENSKTPSQQRGKKQSPPHTLGKMKWPLLLQKEEGK